MANQIPPHLLQQVLGAPQAQVRVPSQAELDEVRRVQGLQVRTNAADQATKLLAGKAPRMTEWHMVAKAIELYIWGEATPSDPPAPVRPGG